MNRSELILKLAELNPQLTTKDLELTVKCILDSLSGKLAKGGRVELRGFGSFCLHYKPARKARNPKTGKIINIPAKYVLHFKPGKELREKVNK
jgi:integration host factor subunit beta